MKEFQDKFWFKRKYTIKIIIKNSENGFFSKFPDVGITKNKKEAHVFFCLNDYHANLILEKTKQFISNNDLNFEIIEKTEMNLNVEWVIYEN